MTQAALFNKLPLASQQALLQLMQDVLVQARPLDKASANLFKTLPQPLHAGLVHAAGALLRSLNRFWFCVFGEDLPAMPLTAATVQQFVAALLQPWSDAMQARNASIEQGGSAQAQCLADGCPQWLDELGQHTANWPAIRKALAQAPRRYIRVNRLKTDRLTLQKALERQSIGSVIVNGVDNALEITSDAAIFRSQAFQDGWFEQQDAGSQYIVQQLPVRPGMRVIDACAGAGGKSLALAAQMLAKGRLLSMDVEEWKLNALKERAKRAGAGNIETRLITSSKTIKRLADSADALLLDVPCSGSGVLKRNPEGKWFHQSAQLSELLTLQADILRRYSKMLKVDGHMLYATCSIFNAENHQQIEAFLQAQPNFVLVRDELIDPATTGWDGFYYALLRRTS